MNIVNEFIEKYVARKTKELHVAFACKVIACTETKAHVQTLCKDQLYLQDIPILGQRVWLNEQETILKPSIHVGDIVFVVCMDQATEETEQGVHVEESHRNHDYNDAVIVGVFSCSLSNL